MPYRNKLEGVAIAYKYWTRLDENVSDTLAYYEMAISIAVKSCMVQTPQSEACTIKIFRTVTVAVS